MRRVSAAGQPLLLVVVKRHQTVLIRKSSRLGAVCRVGLARVGLAKDITHVIADGLDTDEEFLTDLPVSLAAADEAQDFHFPLRQPAREFWRPAWP